MIDQMYNKKGERLYPLHIDRNTFVMVPKDKLTAEYAKQYRKAMERSQRLGKHVGGHSYMMDD